VNVDRALLTFVRRLNWSARTRVAVSRQTPAYRKSDIMVISAGCSPPVRRDLNELHCLHEEERLNLRSQSQNEPMPPFAKIGEITANIAGQA
jgi:hypothetical protein